MNKFAKRFSVLLLVVSLLVMATGCMVNPKVTEYTITYDYNYEGSTPMQVTVEARAALVEPAAESREGYRLAGWYQDAACSEGKEARFGAIVVQDATYYAKWVKFWEYTFYHNDENGTEESFAMYEPIDADYAPAAQADKQFIGWFTDSACTVPAEDITLSGTYYAGWVSLYNYVFDYNYDNIVRTFALTEQIDDLYFITRDGYNFDGWYLDKECTQPVEETKESGTYYAGWVKNNAEDLTYEKKGEIYYVTGVKEGVTLTDIVLPQSYNGSWVFGVTSTGGKSILPAGSYGKLVTPKYVVFFIDDYAFSGCTFTELEFNEGLTSIGDGAFMGANDITDLQKDENGNYKLGKAIEEVVFPASLMGIGNAAFVWQPINKITFAEGSALEMIGDCAFSAIPGIMMPNEGFSEALYQPFTTVTVPASVKSIGLFAFSLTKLEEVYFEDGAELDYLGEFAFANLTYFNEEEKEVSYPSYLTYAELPAVESASFAFADCYNLKKVEFKGDVNYLYGTFEGCTSLEYVDLPASVSYLPYAFRNSGIKSITLPDNLVVTDDAFDGVFSDCDNLEEVTFGENTYMERLFGTFAGCTSLTTVNNLPDSIIYIDAYAFYMCESLTELTLPATVEYIGYYAFAGASSLKLLVLPNAEKPATVVFNAFEGACEEMKIFVPDLMFALYTRTSFFLRTDRFVPELTCANPDYPTAFSYVLGKGVEAESLSVYYSPDERAEMLYMDNYITVDGEKYAFTGWYSDEECTALYDFSIPVGFNDTVIYADYQPCGELANLYEFALTEKMDAYVIVEASETLAGEIELPAYFCGKPVIGIEDGNRGVFESATGITSVIVPATYKFIGNRAFNHVALTAVTFAEGSKLERIGEYAFNCVDGAITSVVIPDTVTAIGDYAFCGNHLSSIVLGESVVTIGAFAFADEAEGDIAESAYTELVIPASVERIEMYAFYGAAALEKLTFAEGSKLSIIGEMAFALSNQYADAEAKANKLTSLVTPASLREIGDSAFANRNAFTEVVLNEGLCIIGNGAFNLYSPSENDSLEIFKAMEDVTSPATLSIPSTVYFIGHYAFQYWVALKEVVFNGNDFMTAEGASFGVCVFANSANLEKISGLGTVKMADIAQSFGISLKVTAIKLPKGMTLSYASFHDLGGLKSIDLSNGYYPSGDVEMHYVNAYTMGTLLIAVRAEDVAAYAADPVWGELIAEGRYVIAL